jgi:hypothetical protein
VQRSRTPGVSLEEAKVRFEQWRQNRKGKTPIPDELWAIAVGVARKEGLNRASTGLRVEWNQLKRRMAGARQTSPKSAPPPAFVELVGPQAQSVPECILEVEGRHGKLRIQLKGASASDLATLSRALWEAAS